MSAGLTNALLGACGATVAVLVYAVKGKALVAVLCALLAVALGLYAWFLYRRGRQS